MNQLLKNYIIMLGRSLVMIITGIGIVALGAYIAFLAYQIIFYVPNVRVPSVLGLELDYAQQVLHQSGLKIKVIDSQLFRDDNQFYVIKQNPTAESEIKKNRTVEVEISESNLSNQVPDLVGKTVEEAETMLLDSGYQIGNIAYSIHNQLPKGRIIAQTPNPGEDIQDNGEVNILVSKGLY